MDRTTARTDPEALLAQRDWVRRVARALVRDQSSADDLEQGVWVRTLERPPALRASPRAWLGTVLRRLAWDSFRGEGRRRRREEAAARPEATPAADEAVARAEALRRVVDAALDLREPYRTVVVLRFFEDLPPAGIAARLGVPLETVRTRLRRALEMLRERLDGEHGGDRRAWLALLLPLAEPGATPLLPAAHPSPGEVGAWSGGDAAVRAAGVTFREVTTMGIRAVAASVLGLVLAAGAGWWLLREMEAVPAPPPASPAPVVPAPPPPGPERPPVPTLNPAAPAPSRRAAEEGKPPVGDGAALEAERKEALRDAAAAALTAEEVARKLQDVDEARRAVAERLEDFEGKLVAEWGERKAAPAPADAPCIEGRVVDEAGNPVAGGTIRILPSGGAAKDGVTIRANGNRADFRSPKLEADRLYDVSVGGLAGYAGAVARGVAPDGAPITLTLRRGGRIEGRVLDPEGKPVVELVFVHAEAVGVPPADLGLGDKSVTYRGAEGVFVLDGLGEFRFRIRAVGKDHPPVYLPGTYAPGDKVEIRVARGVSLRGRLLDWKPPPKGLVQLRADAVGGEKLTKTALVAADGTFEVRGVPRGPVRLELIREFEEFRTGGIVLGTFDAPAEGLEVRVP